MIKEVRFKLALNEYETLKSKANAAGLKTVSQFCKFVLASISNSDNKDVPLQFEDKGNILRKSVKVYLEPEQINILDHNANLHGWSRSKEIAFRIRATLSDEPNLYLEEMRQLDLARVALDRVGRNINYIIRNRMVVVDNTEFKNNIDEILTLTKTVHNIVIECVEQSKNRFLK